MQHALFPDELQEIQVLAAYRDGSFVEGLMEDLLFHSTAGTVPQQGEFEEKV
jgi:hypothetical protein